MTVADSLRHIIAHKDSLLEAAAASRRVLQSPAVNPWTMLASAFFGAFFAFLFTRIGEWLTGKLARGKLHRNSLVRLERLCQDYLNEIVANKSLAGGAVKALEASVPYWSFPHSFTIEKSFTVDVLDIDLASRVMSMNTLLVRYNHTVEDLRRGHDDIQREMLAGHIPLNSWVPAVQREAPHWAELLTFLDSLDVEVRDIGVRVILLVRQYGSSPARLLRLAGYVRSWPLDEAQVGKERRGFDGRREKLLAESRERIAQLRSRAGAGSKTPGTPF